MVLEVRGVIDPIVARYVARGIGVACQSGAELVVIQLDTPGGVDSAMREIVQAILKSDVPVAVFVAPRGARAASAGLFITMAAHVAAMSPGTNIGAAHPVDLSQGEIPDTIQDKITNDAAAYIQAIAQQSGRNAQWAEEAVRKSVSITAQQALENQTVDLVADDLAGLLARLDGRKITLRGQERTLQIAARPVERYPMTWLETVAHGIMDPNIAYVLLSLGTLALIAEFYHPGAILPGVTGVIALILAFVAFGSLPVNWGGIALIVLAFIFFIADIKVTGVALSVAGAISFVLGSLLLFSPFTPATPVMPRLYVNPWLLASMTAVLVSFFSFALAAGLRAQRQAVLTDSRVLLGKTGVALSDLAPQGVVQVQSEMWSAVAAEGPVRAGETVEVVEVKGLRLWVRRLIQ
jgi:membrane-bound serine protease (ClpP class)